MSTHCTHVLLNVLNKLRKKDKMRGLFSILPLFHNKFNPFNNTKARMLNSIYHMILRLLLNLHSNFGIMYAVITFPVNL